MQQTGSSGDTTDPTTRPDVPSVDRQSTPWWRQGAVTLVLVSVAMPIMVFTALVTVLSPEIPAASEMPALPAGLHVVRETASCGSGSCYRELIIGGAPGASPDQLADALHRPAETCRNNGLLDFKQRCVGVDRVGDDVRLYVSVSEFW